MDQDSALKKYTLLYLDDEPPNLRAFERSFRFDYDILTANHGMQALEILQKREIHLIITDQRMPGMSGLEFLQQAMLVRPQAVRLILTAFTDNEVLLKAIQEGKVFDYILKPWRRESLTRSLDAALKYYQDRFEKIARLQNRLSSMEAELEEWVPKNWIGAESGLKNILAQVRKVSPTEATVLIRGESGTGKELLAKAVHENSQRRHGPFVRVNASAFSSGVLESELFGHEKGAFTGALQQKKGRFELADGGTLFLDEVGDLPEDVQVKLLRVLQEREFERVGGQETLRIDVRLVAATHRPLELLIEQGRFREDLFYRLNVVPLFLPPLRERREDVPLLLEYFLDQFNRRLGKNLMFSAAAQQVLLEYPWPGNIRELRNLVERCVTLGEPDEAIAPAALMLRPVQEIAVESWPQWDQTKPLRAQLKDQEFQRSLDALRQARGNLAEAGRLLGVPRTTLFSRLKKWGLA